MTDGRLRENAATAAGRRVVAALDARDFDALAELFDDDYVEAIQRPGQTPVPRDEMLRGIRALVEDAGGSLTIEPIATLGERFQMHRTHISVPTPDSEPHAIDYASVVEVASEERLLRTEAFDVERLGDAIVRLYERYAASAPAGERIPALLSVLFASTDARIDDVLALGADTLLVRCTDPASGRSHLDLAWFPEGRAAHNERFAPDDEAAAFARLDELRTPA